MKSLLVIGATTLVGEHICQQFLAAGWQVLACSRRAPPERMRHPNLIPITAKFDQNFELWDRAFLRNCSEVEIVIHAGGWHGTGASHATLYQEHAIRTAHILQFCRHLPKIHHYYQISSTRVAGDFAGPFDESCGALGQTIRDPLASAVFAGERMVAQSDLDFSCNIIRLGEIIGSTQDGSFPRVSGLYHLLAGLHRIARWKSTLQALTFFPFAFTETARLPLLPVDLAAAAVCALIERHKDSEPRTWHILGGEHGVSARKILGMMLHHVGLELEPVAMPFSIVPSRLWQTLQIPLDTVAALSSPTDFRSKNFEQLVPDFKFMLFKDYAGKLFDYADKFLLQERN
ncbi:MAG: NAD-dependent epimerase/dehydratase family protein [Proteobacteria bacterium]|nr:NAD-dependent epimerase/dehydratase family protein [Pseudomonadota bacterium]